ncbi:hypothetical protein RHAB21_00731 [Pseudorhizobium halotolerans]|uniref:Major tropism determinant N-terminal domain-containing protein n=1 Tax=Pseudorhizobium halotolerans TaxID=1233081 RepID=A0ABM8PYZ4_9HYPH|nr:hypothetical protein [Pseudorhizobium halotolerans]CAD7055511.1 hypothetical protein RHAB21_00731 [Pseudorhizobium halotolerans]
MSEAIKRRRGTDAEHSTFVGLEGEFTFNTTTKRIHAHDAVTPGGIPAARLDEVGGGSASELVEAVKTDDYTLTVDDAGIVITANKATTITFALPAVGASNAEAYLVYNAGAGTLVIDPNASEQIEGASSISLLTGESARIWPNEAKTLWRATVWMATNKNDVIAALFATPKTIKSANFALSNDGGGKALFDTSAIAAGQSRSIKLPDRDTAIGRTLLRITTFTASGTWTPHPDAKMVCFAAQGAGGGGGGVAAAGTGVGGGAGGGGGGYQERWLVSGWGATEPITVGAMGSGGIGGGAPTAGGDSSVGTLCVGKGGGAGASGTTRVTGNQRAAGPGGDGGGGTGTGGVSAGMDIVIPGDGGRVGVLFGTGLTALSGEGGGSALGSGGRQVTEGGSSGNIGQNGTGYGGGGSGASNASANAYNGGNGAPGIVIITEWS